MSRRRRRLRSEVSKNDETQAEQRRALTAKRAINLLTRHKQKVCHTGQIRLSSCLGHDLARTLNIPSHLLEHAQGFPRDLDSLQRFEFAKLVPHRRKVKSKQPRSVGALPHDDGLSKNSPY